MTTRPLYWHPLIDTLSDRLGATEGVYLVGGIVRDTFMRRLSHDVDLATVGDGRPVARKIANAFDGDYYPLDDERGVGRALVEFEGKTWTIDVAQLRGDSLEADLRDRDFTLNAMAVALDDLDTLIDPTGGARDIEQKAINLCQPQSIANDPVRAVRGVRMSMKFGMKLSPSTVKAIRADGPGIAHTSPERVRDEFFKLLDLPNASGGLQTLDMLGLLPLILPETQAMKGVEQSPPHTLDVWRHTMSVVDFMSKVITTMSDERDDDTATSIGLGMIAFGLAKVRTQLQAPFEQEFPNERSYRALMMLAALAHDAGKPVTRSVDDDGRIRFFEHEAAGAEIVEQWALNLRLSSDETKRLKTIVLHHMRPHHLYWAEHVTRRALYRYWRDLGEVGVDVALLGLADTLGIYNATLNQADWIRYVERIQWLLEGYYLETDTLVTFEPLVDGNQVMQAFNLEPGPKVGEILRAAHEAQALGEFSTLQGALDWIRDWLSEEE
ncbi:MAG: HD domain-containing protein [Chloroflexi bacterium]|nr:HD domain-containing protein [Chloroflexota bacterium]